MTMTNQNSVSEKWFRLGILGVLYFVQGLPSGFQHSCLPIILRRDGSASFTSLGAMKLLSIPWIFKPLYAPLVNSHYLSKKQWLVLAMTALAALYFVLGTSMSTQDMVPLSIGLLLINLCSSVNNVALDNLAVQTLIRKDFIGLANTVQTVGYKSGSVISGGVFLLVQDYFGWTSTLCSFTVMYVLCISLVTQLELDKKDAKNITGKSNSSKKLLETFSEVMKTPGTSWLVFFLLFYKTSERCMMTFSLYLVDKQVPAGLLASWSSVINICSLIGSAYGGYLVSDVQSTHSILLKYFTLRAVGTALLFATLINWQVDSLSELEAFTFDWTVTQTGFLLLCLVGFSAGVITTATFTLLLASSKRIRGDPALSGTHYTTLAAVEGIGKLAFATFSGYLLDYLGLRATYFLFVVLAVIAVPITKTAPAILFKDL